MRETKHLSSISRMRLTKIGLLESLIESPGRHCTASNNQPRRDRMKFMISIQETIKSSIVHVNLIVLQVQHQDDFHKLSGLSMNTKQQLKSTLESWPISVFTKSQYTGNLPLIELAQIFEVIYRLNKPNQ